MATINFHLDKRASGFDKPAPLKISIRLRERVDRLIEKIINQ